MKPGVKAVTKWLFVTTQVAALGWVTISYLIALYATVRLGEAFPVTSLSEQAIETILGVNVLKVVENIFEHNDSAVFGTSNAARADDTTGTAGTNGQQTKRDC